MADLAQRAEMRRRRILMRSEERMKKLLGPNAIETDADSTQAPVTEDLHPIRKVECKTPNVLPNSSSSTVSNIIQDHAFQVKKSKKIKIVEPAKPWLSDMMVFPIGVIARASPLHFAPMLMLVTLIILVQTSACSTIKSFAWKVLLLVQKAFEVFFMFSFSFIVTEAVILWLT